MSPSDFIYFFIDMEYTWERLDDLVHLTILFQTFGSFF